MAGERLSLAKYRTNRTADGVEVTIASRNVLPRHRRGKPSASSTSGHEAFHAVVAEANGTAVRKVSIIPGPGYLGITELSDFDAVAAAAPHAHGAGGTGHDRAIIEMVGHDVSTAGATAEAIVNQGNTSAQIAAVADALEMQGTLDGAGVRRIMHEVDEDARNTEHGRQIVDVFVREVDGATTTIKGIETTEAATHTLEFDHRDVAPLLETKRRRLVLAV